MYSCTFRKKHVTMKIQMFLFFTFISIGIWITEAEIPCDDCPHDWTWVNACTDACSIHKTTDEVQSEIYTTCIAVCYTGGMACLVNCSKDDETSSEED